jgi:hypothetical protein
MPIIRGTFVTSYAVGGRIIECDRYNRSAGGVNVGYYRLFDRATGQCLTTGDTLSAVPDQSYVGALLRGLRTGAHLRGERYPLA